MRRDKGDAPILIGLAFGGPTYNSHPSATLFEKNYFTSENWELIERRLHLFLCFSLT